MKCKYLDSFLFWRCGWIQFAEGRGSTTTWLCRKGDFFVGNVIFLVGKVIFLSERYFFCWKGIFCRKRYCCWKSNSFFFLSERYFCLLLFLSNLCLYLKGRFSLSYTSLNVICCCRYVIVLHLAFWNFGKWKRLDAQSCYKEGAGFRKCVHA